MRRIDVSLLCTAKKTDLESEEMINLEYLCLATMFMARSIAVISTL